MKMFLTFGTHIYYELGGTLEFRNFLRNFFISSFLHSEMSDFSQLKQQRKANKPRSFVASAVPVHGEPEKQETDGLNNMAVVHPGVSSQETFRGQISA